MQATIYLDPGNAKRVIRRAERWGTETGRVEQIIRKATKGKHNAHQQGGGREKREADVGGGHTNILTTIAQGQPQQQHTRAST